jgi:hypothetical protein
VVSEAVQAQENILEQVPCRFRIPCDRQRGPVDQVAVPVKQHPKRFETA